MRPKGFNSTKKDIRDRKPCVTESANTMSEMTVIERRGGIVIDRNCKLCDRRIIDITPNYRYEGADVDPIVSAFCIACNGVLNVYDKKPETDFQYVPAVKTTPTAAKVARRVEREAAKERSTKVINRLTVLALIGSAEL